MRFQCTDVYGCPKLLDMEAERSFSALRRIKIHLRNRMGEDRLAALTLLNINSNLDIDPNEIVARFIKMNPRRLFRSLYND